MGWPNGGGGTLIYGLYRYVLLNRACFFADLTLPSSHRRSQVSTLYSRVFFICKYIYLFYHAYCLEQGTYISNVCLEQGRKFTFFLWNMYRVSVIRPPPLVKFLGILPLWGRKVNIHFGLTMGA